MYKVLNIGGKDYCLEYTIEASLYSDCTEKLVDFFGKTAATANIDQMTDGLSEEEKSKVQKEVLENQIKGLSNIPNTAMTLFYAGLIQYHGKRGDRTVMSIDDAKDIIARYFYEHQEDGTDNFYDVLTMCMDQMAEDGFFKRVGLEKVMAQSEEGIDTQKPNRAARRAQAKTKATENK